VSTSLKTPSTSSVFSRNAENETLPALSPMLLSTLAAMFSSCSSNCSPVLVLVPPVRITMPVIVATPILSAGSNKFPVRTRATPWMMGSSWSSSKKSFMPLGSVNVATLGIWMGRSGGNLRSW